MTEKALVRIAAVQMASEDHDIEQPGKGDSIRGIGGGKWGSVRGVPGADADGVVCLVRFVGLGGAIGREDSLN